MTKVFVIAGMSFLLLIACKKDYTCTCMATVTETKNGFYVIDTQTIYITSSKSKDAKEQCDGLEDMIIKEAKETLQLDEDEFFFKSSSCNFSEK